MSQNHNIVAIFLFAAVLTACSEKPQKQSDDAGIKESNNSVLKVETVSAQALVKENTIFASGTVAAKQTSNIGALTAGVIEEIFVKVGDRVTKGQPLFRTRRIDYELRLNEALSALEIAKAEASNAAAVLNRYSSLSDSQAVAQLELDQVKKQASIANAQVALRETQVQSASQALEDTVVKAPFTGAVTSRYQDEGVYLTNAFSGMGNSAVVQVQECEIAAAILFAPESVLGVLRKGLVGKLGIDGQDAIGAEITIINDRIDSATRQIEFRMPFLNPDCTVKAGQSVRAEIEAVPSDVLILPRKVVRGFDPNRFVWAIENGKAVQLDVRVQDFNSQSLQVITGVSKTDKVVGSHFELLSEGMPLESTSP